MGKKKKTLRANPLIKNPKIAAGIILIIDTLMLAVGLVLSNVHPETTYTFISENGSGIDVEHSRPLAFFGVIAAAALGVVCVLTAFIIAGAVAKKRRAAQLVGAVLLVILSLAMLGAAAVTAVGIPAKKSTFSSLSDESYTVIIEEEQPYYGTGKVYFFMMSAEAESGTELKLLASTDISEYSAADDDRYSISWISDDILMIAFSDGGNYRTLQISL